MHWLDPDHLPELEGTVDRFLLNPHGDADGMILTNGTEIHFPPHMASEVLDAVRLGTTIKVRGVRPRAAGVVAAVAIEVDDGCRIVDRGPPEDHGKRREARRQAAKLGRKAMQAEGVVQRALHGPKGEIRGVLLEDGRIVRFPHDRAAEVAELIAAGARLVVRGKELTTPIGIVLEAHEMGSSEMSLRRLSPKEPKKHKPEGDAFSHDGRRHAGDLNHGRLRWETHGRRHSLESKRHFNVDCKEGFDCELGPFRRSAHHRPT